MKVELVYASAERTVHSAAIDAPPGCTLGQALALAGWLDRFPEIDAHPLAVGIWNHKATRETTLREDDRVEVYRGLRVDPKVARRERFTGQGARTAGLFSRRRPGAKPGY